MLTITDVVKELLKKTPLIEEALSKDLINYSSLARLFKPEIEKRLFKTVEIPSIVMALKRTVKKLKLPSKKLKKLEPKGELAVRSNLTEYILVASESAIRQLGVFAQILTKQANAFFALTKGVREIDVIVSDSLRTELMKLLRNEKIIAKVEDLSLITLFHSEGAVFTPGFHYSILKALAWENINVIEIVSTYTELTIILQSKDVDAAFSVLKHLVS